MTTTSAPTASLATVMFSVRDQDAALAFYTRIGWELRDDVRYGPDGESRWLEVAPPGSVARVALTPPMGGAPGGSAVGVEVADVSAEHERLTAVGGLDLDPAPRQIPGAPLMFALRDPDGNHLWIVSPTG